MDTGLDVLYDEVAIGRMVTALGKRISRDYAGKDLLLVGVLKGAALFLADLARAVTVPLEVELIQASSYGSAMSSSGTVRITRDITRDIAGRHVLVADCIIDSGGTLAAVLETLRERRPASLRAVVLLDKKTRRTTQVTVDYAGFEVPDRFLVGYGLDRAGRYRNLPYIAAVGPEGA
jgi:hypoxanthine phosphoribosyltransferase